MKKNKKVFLIILLSLIMCMTSVPAFANETPVYQNAKIIPYANHTGNCTPSFNATADGGYFLINYNGYDSFVRADLSVKVERRYLWVIWTEVGEWSASSTSQNGQFYHVFELTGSGTYRATFTLTITGNDGTVDTIEQVIESKY